MYGHGRTRSTLRFALKTEPGVGRVAVAGDFSDWKPVAMKKCKPGCFVRHVRASNDTIEYKFIVDGQWITDPDNSHVARNQFGSFNSVASAKVEAALQM